LPLYIQPSFKKIASLAIANICVHHEYLIDFGMLGGSKKFQKNKKKMIDKKKSITIFKLELGTSIPKGQ
jgi:hypothetical protein